MQLFKQSVKNFVQNLIQEDQIEQSMFYLKSLPDREVECELYVKNDAILCGFYFFTEVFNALIPGCLNTDVLFDLEGKFVKGKTDKPLVRIALPFSAALTGERLALNLLQHGSGVSTLTRQYVDKTKKYGIKILDTRKTTPGLRNLEKYAVTVGGAYNHRLSQTDIWMIKDNHKTFFGGLKKAVEHFQNLHDFYRPLIVEIHSEAEFDQACELNLKHVMLDNFTPASIANVLKNKPAGMTIEISGGINLDTIEQFCLKGVDAISVGAITSRAPRIDMSLKIKK
jgi:nicotinate-nucleotide pyrophosphorylase (carboxylating)